MDAASFSKKYLEDLLTFYGLNIDVEAYTEGEVVKIAVPSTAINKYLIGSNADTLLSFQSVLSAALRTKGLEPSRVNLDIADYKKEREHKLIERALPWIEEVKKTGEPKTLEPMNSADRRIVHKLASDHGLSTDSAGEGPTRHVVIGG